MIKLILQKELTLIRCSGNCNSTVSRECIFCHYWHYLNKNSSYGSFTCDGCYNIVQKSTDFKNIVIARVKKSAYRIYFKDISKHKAKRLMKKFDLIGKAGDIYGND